MKALFPFQARAVEQARQAAGQGARAILIVAPTGAGKTRIGVEFASATARNGRKTLWITHRKELVDQAREALLSEGLPSVGVIRASDERVAPDAPVQVASIQTLAARGLRPDADVLVFDECHHIAAKTWAEVECDYRHTYRLGLTATPERSDGSPLGDVFQVLVRAATYRELIECGRLVDCDVWAPAKRMTSSIATTPWGAYRQLGGGRPAIIFCASRDQARATVAELGPGARHIDGASSQEARDEAVWAFREGLCDILVNCMVLTEGFDAPRAEVCVVARAASSPATYVQMVGRVLRSATGKSTASVLDLTGAVLQHGWPTDDRDYALDGKHGVQRGNASPGLWQCLGCGAVLRARPEHCPRCGLVPLVQKPLRVIETPMARQERFAREPESAKAEYLERLKAEARAKGYKFGWVAYKYKAKYGGYPDVGI